MTAVRDSAEAGRAVKELGQAPSQHKPPKIALLCVPPGMFPWLSPLPRLMR